MTISEKKILSLVTAFAEKVADLLMNVKDVEDLFRLMRTEKMTENMKRYLHIEILPLLKREA